MSTLASSKQWVLLDPELDPVEVARLEHDLPYLVCANPLQEAALERAGKSWAALEVDIDRCQRRFDDLTEFLTRSRDERRATIDLRGVRRTYPVSLASFLEFGHALELYVLLDEVASQLAHAEEVHLISARAGFTRIARAVFSLGPTSRVRVEELPRPISPRDTTPAPRNIADRVPELIGEALGYILGSRRARVLALPHRQILSVREAMRARGDVTLLGDALFKSARLLARWADAARTEEEITSALQAIEPRGEELLWRRVLAGQARALAEEAISCQRICVALDMLSPHAILSPAWGGGPAHTQRIWCQRNGRTFGVIQHGFQYGTTLSPRTRRVDVDVFYTWGAAYDPRWIDRAVNPGVPCIPSGDPASLTNTPARAKINGEPTRVLVAPSSCFDFARARYLQFWEALFAYMEARPEREWVLRPHKILRNFAWLDARARALGIAIEPAGEKSLQEAMVGCDVVLTSVSSVVINAMQVGRPVIVFNVTGEPEYFSDHFPDAVIEELETLPEDLDDAFERVGELELQQRAFFEATFEVDAPATIVCEDLLSRIGR